MGLLPLATGELIFKGENIRPQPVHSRARLGIGYVPQGREIFSQLTVEENLKIGLPARADKKKVVPEHIYDMFPMLKNMLHRRGGDLSGGQQQQLAIGRALVIEPTMLILDEPTEGIQPNIIHEIGDVIINLRKAGLTVLLVEQKLPIARRVADQFHMLDKGRLVVSGNIDELTDDLVHKHLTV
jgi:urea transport system ATP-binding protein